MTVKFYLQYRATGKWTDWVGADQRDSLHKKWTHFHNKQLPLGRHPATIEKLIEDGMSRPVRVGFGIAVCYFLEWNSPCLLPKFLLLMEPSMPHSLLDIGFDGKISFNIFQYQHRWVIRDHPHWLSPVETEDALTTIEVMDTPMNRGFLMLAEMEAHGLGWREQRRWVLVEDDWGSRVNNAQ